MIRRPMVSESGILILGENKVSVLEDLTKKTLTCGFYFIPSFNCVIENICVVLTLLKVRVPEF